jgi:hypothetical protein
VLGVPAVVATTVIEDVPVLVSLVAVIIADPADAAVTSPVEFTVAAAVLSDAQVTVRPVRVVPPASLIVVVNCCVLPTATVAVGGLTVTVATSIGLTVIVGVGLEFTDSLVAVIAAVPSPAAVTVVVPLVELAGLTASTAALLETQVTVRPVRVVLLPSFSVAVRACVPPTTIGVVGAETVTVATGAGALTGASEFPSQSSILTVEPYIPTPGEPVARLASL